LLSGKEKGWRNPGAQEGAEKEPSPAVSGPRCLGMSEALIPAKEWCVRGRGAQLISQAQILAASAPGSFLSITFCSAGLDSVSGNLEPASVLSC
jgi:hypothetical protein